MVWCIDHYLIQHAVPVTMDIVQLLSNDIFIQIMSEYSLSPGELFLAAEYKIKVF
jgi:hypothetical protein